MVTRFSLGPNSKYECRFNLFKFRGHFDHLGGFRVYIVKGVKSTGTEVTGSSTAGGICTALRVFMLPYSGTSLPVV
jgi:hypothetical protein